MALTNLAVAIAPFLLASAAGGGGTAAASGSKKGGMSLAESFLMSTGALPFGDNMKAVTPFTAPTPAMRARSLGQMGLGSRGSGQAGRIAAAQRVLESNVDVQTAVANMRANATNPQFRDYAQKYASPLLVRARRDPKLVLDAPGDINVKTASA